MSAAATLAHASPLDLAVIGGGAAGVFAALQFAELAPDKTVAVFEKSGRFLHKVRISGGGRCNVTHACDSPRELANHYPRGGRELMAAFHQWQPADTVAWFERCGVPLKIEADGRMFPESDRSESIIECFLERARACRIPLWPGHPLTGIEALEGGGFALRFSNLTDPVRARAVCLAVGSLQGSPLIQALERLKLTVEPPVPSLFALNVIDGRLSGLAGVAHPGVSVRLAGSRAARQGPLLITHRGLSGPAVLRLSAWEARAMAATHYHFPLAIDWLPAINQESLKECFADIRRRQGAKLVRNTPIAPIPRRLWERIVACCGIEESTIWGQLSKTASRMMLDELKCAHFDATGKTTHKDEFVTCGGIARPTIDFRTMESRAVPGLYFAGECVDIDGLTGGFNFQAAWTTGFIAARAIAEGARLSGES
jgi:predicted Rossmann fold flavoprotein